MALIYCRHCGQQVSDQAQFCPHCGTSLAVGQKQKEYEDIETTDTGYENEELLARLTNIVMAILCVLGVLVAIGGFICFFIPTTEYMPSSTKAVLFIGGVYLIILGGLTVLLAYILKAKMSIFINMSINLHEINLKTA